MLSNANAGVTANSMANGKWQKADGIRMPSVFSVFFGQLQGVIKEHRDRHRPDAARYGGDREGFVADRIKIDVAAKFSLLVSIDADIHDNRSFFDHRGLH